MNDAQLKKIEEEAIAEARAKVDAGEDKAHLALLDDISALYLSAKAFQFHDFLNTEYALPKQALAAKLNDLRDRVISGKYDN